MRSQGKGQLVELLIRSQFSLRRRRTTAVFVPREPGETRGFLAAMSHRLKGIVGLQRARADAEGPPSFRAAGQTGWIRI